MKIKNKGGQVIFKIKDNVIGEDLTNVINKVKKCELLLELKIGKRFIYKKSIIEVVKDDPDSDNICGECYFRGKETCKCLTCDVCDRKRHTDVHFKKIN